MGRKVRRAVMSMYNSEDIQDALLDMYDVRNALPSKILNSPKDDEGTDITIGDCIDSVISLLEALDAEGD